MSRAAAPHWASSIGQTATEQQRRTTEAHDAAQVAERALRALAGSHGAAFLDRCEQVLADAVGRFQVAAPHVPVAFLRDRHCLVVRTAGASWSAVFHFEPAHDVAVHVTAMTGGSGASRWFPFVNIEDTLGVSCNGTPMTADDFCHAAMAPWLATVSLTA